MTRARSIATLALGCALSFAASGAAAGSPQVAAGRAAFERASFAAARRAFDRVLADTAATRDDLAAAYGYLATIALAQGEQAVANSQAEAALALEPSMRPPDGASPDAATLFDQVRAARAGVVLGVAIGAPRPSAADGGSSLVVTARGVPASLALRLRIRCHGDAPADLVERTVPGVEGATPVALPALATDARLACDAVLETASGVVVARGEWRAPVVAAPASAVVMLPAAERRTGHDDERARRGVGVGWIALGVGGAAVVVAAVLTGVVFAVAPRPTDARLGGLTVTTGGGP